MPWKVRNPAESWRRETGETKTITDGKHRTLKIGTESRDHFPPFPPLQDSAGFLALQGILPVSSLFSSYMPPLRLFLCIQPAPSSVWSPPSSVPHRPSVGKLPTLRLWTTNFLFCFPGPAFHMQSPPPTCAAGGTWLGFGWGGEGDGAPRDGLESFVSSAGITRASACL